MKKASDPITRETLRAAVESAPDTIQVQVLLGLDGDCDFARQVTDFFPYLASKEELLALLNAKAEDFPPALPHAPRSACAESWMLWQADGGRYGHILRKMEVQNET